MIVNKKADKLKAEEQTKRSSFVKNKSDHIAQVRIWAGKWYAACDMSKEWEHYIYIENAQPGKEPTL